MANESKPAFGRPEGLPPSGPEDRLPPDRRDRERLREVIRQHMRQEHAEPPFTMAELTVHADAVVAQAGLDPVYRKFAAVLLSNEAWADTLAAIPFDRRLLLLPMCLRDPDNCQGQIDEFGLLCAACGRCPISNLKDEAEALGYTVLVAEGSAVVMALIQARQLQAVVGVSCLSALEAIYPLMQAAAVPGMAMPLLYNGCVRTTVDLDWVREAIGMTRTLPGTPLDLDAMRGEVEHWFTAEALESALGPAPTETERIARTWLAKTGKRWRPVLAACAYQAFRSDPESPLPEEFRKVAVAVECFHKASLIHDDIEDADQTRYGDKTLHEQYGIPIALNVGDLMLGEGYRMIGEVQLAPDRRTEMLQVAAEGHRNLSVGQGMELCWTHAPVPLSADEVIDIFRRKTAPAFEVALRLGALAAGAEGEVWTILHRYSEALGIAYQIRDDLNDWHGDGDPGDGEALRPSILLAVAHERARGDDRLLLDTVWRRMADPQTSAVRLQDVFGRFGVVPEVRRLLEYYRDEAVESLEGLPSTPLKSLLRRVIFKIFLDLKQGSTPGEHQVRPAPGRTPGPTTAR
jgi:geranylgeranyl diphosphate synthase, type II